MFVVDMAFLRGGGGGGGGRLAFFCEPASETGEYSVLGPAALCARERLDWFSGRVSVLPLKPGWRTLRFRKGGVVVYGLMLPSLER